MATRIHRPLKVTAFIANGIARQRYELSKQLQDYKFSETHLKLLERYVISNYYLYWTERHMGRKDGTPPLVSEIQFRPIRNQKKSFCILQLLHF
jgi:hypothetical protein